MAILIAKRDVRQLDSSTAPISMPPARTECSVASPMTSMEDFDVFEEHLLDANYWQQAPPADTIQSKRCLQSAKSSAHKSIRSAGRCFFGTWAETHPTRPTDFEEAVRSLLKSAVAKHHRLQKLEDRIAELRSATE
ncbi:unnamed protein product [Dibothriocephalus latus]|uniref:Uncharacterized protein n=1 Tax=Dibothriocephalus latus TaxID=60516 RepID=A0A3P7RP52_DIBLA|nr:unnamed protein product [Dibothriocephalus latus]